MWWKVEAPHTQAILSEHLLCPGHWAGEQAGAPPESVAALWWSQAGRLRGDMNRAEGGGSLERVVRKLSLWEAIPWGGSWEGVVIGQQRAGAERAARPREQPVQRPGSATQHAPWGLR